MKESWWWLKADMLQLKAENGDCYCLGGRSNTQMMSYDLSPSLTFLHGGMSKTHTEIPHWNWHWSDSDDNGWDKARCCRMDPLLAMKPTSLILSCWPLQGKAMESIRAWWEKKRFIQTYAFIYIIYIYIYIYPLHKSVYTSICFQRWFLS